MIRDIDPFVVHCLWTSDEFIDTSIWYGITFRDMIRVAFNIAYRLGKIYDASMSLYYLS